jgi:hypothetical protein
MRDNQRKSFWIAFVLLAFFGMCAWLCASYCPPPSFQYVVDGQGVVMIETEPNHVRFLDGKFIASGQTITRFTYREFFDYMADHWLEKYKGYTFNGHDLNVLFRHVNAKTLGMEKPVVAEPNEPNLAIGFGLETSDVYHLYLDCRYLTGKTNITLIDPATTTRRVCLTCLARQLADNNAETE